MTDASAGKAPMHRWYLVHTKPAGEGKARENLERQGFEVYFPRLLRPRRIRARWVERIEPLFPRYLFLRLDVGEQALGPVRSTLGVSSVVRFGQDYTIVPESVVESLRSREDEAGLHRLAQRETFRPGEAVRVVAGAFDGLEGVFQREAGEDRVVVLLTLLGQDTAVRIDAGLVVPKRQT